MELVVQQVGDSQPRSPTSSQITKEILSESWPFVLSRFFGMSTQFLTTLILSQRDEDYLAVTPLLTSYQLLTGSASVVVFYALAIASGKRIGQKKPEEIGSLFQACGILTVLLTVLNIPLWIFSKEILILFSQSSFYAAQTAKYFQPLLLGLPGFLFLNACQQLLVGISRPKAVLLITVMTAILLGGFGTLFVFYADLGIPGMSYAFTLANWTTLLVTLIWLNNNTDFQPYCLFEKPSYQILKQRTKELSALGFPIVGQVFSELATVLVITLFAGVMGKDALAAKQIADQYLALFVTASFGFAQTTGTKVSRAAGEKNFELCKKTGNVALAVGFVASLGVCTLFCAAYKELTWLLNSNVSHDKSQLTLIFHLFLINGIGEVFDYARNIAPGALRGYYQTKEPMIINSIAMLGVGLGTGYALGFHTSLGLAGLFLGRSLGMAVGAVANLILWAARSNNELISIDTKPLLTH